MESSPFDPPLFPEFSPVAWIPPAVFFYAALVLAIATALHAYMELFFLFSEKAPRVRPCPRFPPTGRVRLTLT